MTSEKPLLRYNTFAELQQEICDIVNTAPELSACGVTFYPENALDIDYQITNSLKKQGIAAVVMTPDARYIGYEDRGCVYQLDNLTLMISEFPAVNRASNRRSVATGLDIANFCAEILAGPNAIVGFGKLNVKSIEQGEDSGLLVTKVTFQTVLSNGEIPPYIWVEYVTHEELSAAIDDLSATVDSRLSSTTPASRAKMLPDYLYELDFSDSYPEAAQEIYDEFDIGKCSAVREGNAFARNYDWLFSEAATFVVNRNKTGNVHSSVGVASVGSKITNADVKSGKWMKWYKALPGMTLDGINDAGVFGSINVVAAKTPVGYSGTYCGFGAIRYVLDNFDNATDAAQWVAQNVYVPPKFLEQGYSLHYLIGDADTTWIVEDGVARPVFQDRTVLTNFRLFNDSDDIHTDRADIAAYDPYGTGLERYDLLNEHGVSAIFDARFTKAYDTGFPRPTEFVGATPDLTLSSSDQDLRAWAASHVPHIRERGDGTWQSVHTSEYDIANRTLTLRVQEVDDPYVFVVPAYTKEDLVLAWGNLSGELTAQTDLYNELTSIKADISANAAGISAAVEAIGTVSTDLNTVSSDLISLSDIVKVHTTKITSLSDELSTQSARIDIVQRDISQLSGDFDVLSAKSNALSTRAEATDLAVAAVSADLGALSVKVENNTADIGDILDDIDVLAAKTTPVQPSTDAPLSALAGAKATADFVNSSINAFAAFYITKDLSGNAFATKADLLSTAVFYNAGQTRVPTKNDYCIVLADESQKKPEEVTIPTTRYSWQGTAYPDGQWEFQYIVNDTALTQAQVNAINSGITKDMVDNRVTPSMVNPGYAVWSESSMEADFAKRANDAEYAYNAGYAENAYNANTAINASTALTAYTALTADQALTANVALSAYTALTANTALSANRALTADVAPDYTPLTTFNQTLGDLSSIIHGI